MSLVRLLTAGKSFVGLKESANRYRVTGQRLLPKFESNKNPFGASKAETTGASQKPPALQPAAVMSPATPISAPSIPASKIRPKLNGARLARFWKRCVSRLKSPWPPRSRAMPKPVIPRLSKAMVQAELSLEKVKVVRNDLSDSDMEIVRAKAAPTIETLKAQNLEPSLGAGVIATEKGPGTPRLASLAGRLFGAGKH